MSTTLQPIVSELLIEEDWVEVTSLIERDSGQGIRISRRPLTWGERIAPTNANWTFKNEDNNFYGRNPNSIYYGLLGRNTQVRHRLRSVYDTFTRTASSEWGAPDTGPVWTTSGGSASDYSVASGAGKQSLGTVGTARTCVNAHVMLDCDITFDATCPVVPTGATIERGFVARYVDSSNYVDVRIFHNTDNTVSLIVRQVVAGVETHSGFTTVTNITSTTAMTCRYQVKDTVVRAKLYATSADESTVSWQRTLSGVTHLTAGTFRAYTQLNTGNTNATPVVMTWDNIQISSYRFWGEIPSFSPVRDSTGRQKSVPVTAAGLGQRLSTGARTLSSALTSAMDGISAGDIVPIAHWPMEDASGATQLGNLRSGSPATVTGDVSVAGYTFNGPFGSLPVPILNDGGQIAGTFPATIIENDADGNAIAQVQFLGVLPSTMSANTTFMDINVSNVGGDNVVKWQIQWDNGLKTLTARPFTNAGVQLTGAAVDIGSNPQFYDRPVLFALSIFQVDVGGLVSHQFSARIPGGTLVDSNVIGAGLTTSVPVPQSWRAYGTSVNTGWAFGHIALYTDPTVVTVPNITDNANALDGIDGELSGTRMIRLSRQVNIPFELIGDEADTIPCGPQPQGTYLQIMQITADADQGILRDARDALALEYITRTNLLNKPRTLAYSHSNAHDMESFQVVDDDKVVRNKITARRIGGSFALATVTEGGTSISEPPDGIGEYPEDLSWNLHSDEQLLAFAGWRALIKGWDEARYPATAIWRERDEIASVPTLDAATLAMDIGDRYTITDPPDDLPPDDIELLTQGYEELLANFEHKITFDGTAARPYDILELDTDDARADDDHNLRTAVDDNDTSWEINNLNPGVQLIADDAQDGWQWMMAGELVTVTDVTPPTIAFVGVGTASTGSSGSRTPGMPASIATGNIVLIFASTRNSGTGIPDTPANWYRFPVFDAAANAQVFGRIYDGVWSMPTVTYTNGAANEDTIAQSAAFSGYFNDITKVRVASCGCLNPSAQDINISGIPIVNLPENLMGLYFGWKQDDFTSATTPASWTEAQEASTTAGNDASQVFGYRQFTTRPTAGQLTPALAITGGGSAISRGGVLVIASDYQLVTVTRSVNGIVKAQNAGTVPLLIPAAHVAL